MPFEEFQARALYDAEAGFFTAGPLRSAESGDFLTSPEVSPLFGEMLAGFAQREWEALGSPDCFQVVDAGAGSGSLIRGLLAVTSFPVWAVEISPAARGAVAGPVPASRIVTTMDGVPSSLTGVVIANELLDNQPVAVAIRSDAAWRERWVGAEGGTLVFVDVDARPAVADWCEAYAGPVPDHGVVEVQLAAGDWLADSLSRLRAGAVVVIDYGDTAEALSPRRSQGTLRTYRSHHLGPDPLAEPGATDITVDVNFTALEGVAQSSGAFTRLVRQDDFLAEYGLRRKLSELRHDELEAARSGDVGEQLRLRSIRTGAEALLHPRGLGDFRVLVAQVREPTEGGRASN